MYTRTQSIGHSSLIGGSSSSFKKYGQARDPRYVTQKCLEGKQWLLRFDHKLILKAEKLSPCRVYFKSKGNR